MSVLSYLLSKSFFKTIFRIILTAVIFFIVLVIFLRLNTRHGDFILVPDLIGKNIEEFQSELVELDLKYIISDAAREGRRHGNEIKSIYSPIGKPARKSYSLFPIIDEAGKGFEYIEALLKASFQDGINIGDESFLQNVVTDLGLDWQVIKKDLNTKRWKKILNDNVEDMYAGNCWGVPSFKITDQDGGNPFYVWGQDRMWLLKEEIFKRLGD